ncbi:MAG: hypothetical protein JXB43_07095 [Dehalococcoidia bacterium]|nr:hypothetical protein [Dehalococcoidia bacterium]
MKLLTTTKRKLKDESGQALAMALIMLVLGGLLVVPTLQFMTTNLTANRVVDEANLRLYAADAGIQYASSRFLSGVDPADPDFLPSSLTDPVNGCEVTLARQFVGDDLCVITSTATDPDTGKSTEIQAGFQANAAQFETAPSPFDYAVATLGGDLTMTGSSTITSDVPGEGNVWVNGDINLDWNCTIDGDADVTGTCNRPGNIEGTYTPGSEPTERPEWLDDQVECYIANTDVPTPDFVGQTWDTTYTGNTTLGWGDQYTFPGSLHVTGNLTISGTKAPAIYTFNGPVWVEGDLILTSGANFITFKAPVRVGSETANGLANFGGTGTVKFENPAPTSLIAYGSHAPGTVQSSGVYVAGDSASVILTSGIYGDGGAVSLKLQDSYDNSTWTDVSPCGTLPLVDEINDNGTVRQNYTGTTKPYLRVVATVSGAVCPFGVTMVRNTTLHVREYLNVSGSRSCWFDGPVVVNGGAVVSKKYIVYIGGSKYSGVAWDMVFRGTLRATEPVPNCAHRIYLGGSKVFEFYDVVYTNVSAEIAGATGSNMTFTKAFIADCDIYVSGSSAIDAPPTTSPIFVSRFGDVDISGATRVDAIVYAPEGNVHVSGSSQLEGAIVSESALLEGAVNLKYPVVLRERDEVHDPEGGGPGGQSESTYSIVSYSIQ